MTTPTEAQGVSRILHIEDCDADALLVRSVLRNSAVVIERVSSLGAALMALRSSTFDLILTDLVLPDSAGAGTIETLLDTAGLTPVVVLTGQGDTQMIHKAVEAGVHDFLVKGSARIAPQLQHAVRYALERAKERHHDDGREIRRATARFRALTDSSEVTVVVDSQRRCTYASPAIRQMLGFAPAEVTGQPLHSFVHALGRSAQLRHKNGTPIDVDYTATPMFGDDGNVAGTVMTFRNLETRKRLAQEVEQTLRLAVLGRVAASAVHELNNLLTVALHQSELLRKRAANDEALAKPVTLIQDAVRRGRRVSEEILRFTRAPELRLDAIDVRTWIARVAEEGKALVDVRALIVEPAPPLSIRGDADLLSQVMFNLLTNARDATPEDGIVTIGADRAAAIPFVRDRIDEPRDFVAIFVRDNGSGISPEAREHLFEPLFTTKRDSTGFGLATAERIVTQLGGQILVDTKSGEGSTFYIVLPRYGGTR